MPAFRVGDRVVFEGKVWRVTSLGRHAYHRLGDRMIANGELHAVLLLELDQPDDESATRTVVAESRWGEITLDE